MHSFHQEIWLYNDILCLFFLVWLVRASDLHRRRRIPHSDGGERSPAERCWRSTQVSPGAIRWLLDPKDQRHFRLPRHQPLHHVFDYRRRCRPHRQGSILVEGYRSCPNYGSRRRLCFGMAQGNLFIFSIFINCNDTDILENLCFFFLNAGGPYWLRKLVALVQEFLQWPTYLHHWEWILWPPRYFGRLWPNLLFQRKYFQGVLYFPLFYTIWYNNLNMMYLLLFRNTWAKFWTWSMMMASRSSATLLGLSWTTSSGELDFRKLPILTDLCVIYYLCGTDMMKSNFTYLYFLCLFNTF